MGQTEYERQVQLLREEAQHLADAGRYEEANALCSKLDDIEAEREGRRERAALYYQAYLPTLITAIMIWLLMIVSTREKVAENYVSVLTGLNTAYLYIALLSALVAGRLADLYSTLLGISAGATELNPGLPAKAGFSDLAPRLLKETLALAIVSLAALLAFRLGFVPVFLLPDIIPTWVRTSDALQWAVVGVCLIVPALASFSAAISNLLAIWFGSGDHEQSPSIWTAVIGSLLTCLAALALCTQGNEWAPLGLWLPLFFCLVCGEGLLVQFAASSRFVTRLLWVSGNVGVVGAVIWRVLVL